MKLSPQKRLGKETRRELDEHNDVLSTGQMDGQAKSFQEQC